MLFQIIELFFLIPKNCVTYLTLPIVQCIRLRAQICYLKSFYFVCLADQVSFSFVQWRLLNIPKFCSHFWDTFLANSSRLLTKSIIKFCGSLNKIPTFYLKTVFKQLATFFGENTLLKVC